jgi:hypothetical protein
LPSVACRQKPTHILTSSSKIAWLGSLRAQRFSLCPLALARHLPPAGWLQSDLRRSIFLFALSPIYFLSIALLAIVDSMQMS